MNKPKFVLIGTQHVQRGCGPDVRSVAWPSAVLHHGSEFLLICAGNDLHGPGSILKVF